MRPILIKLAFIFAVAMLFGCVGQFGTQCKPMLFPYKEYGYKAIPVRLGTFFNKNDTIQNIELFNLKLSVPEGWRYEKMHEKTYVFRSNDGRDFIFYVDRYAPFEDNDEKLNFIGCNNFNLNQHANYNKTGKDLITDIYLFTEDQLSDDPIFWQFFILWSKRDILHNATDLYHFKGDHLEAFQRNIEHNYDRGELQSEIIICPKKIAPDYLVIGSRFTDNLFFAKFVDMLDTLNP